MLTKKHALITGGAQGIGLGIAEAFLDEGASVVMADRNEEVLEETVATLRSKFPDSQIYGVEGDVSDADAVEKMVAEAVEATPGLNVLVNNAGFGALSRFWEMDPEIWRAVVDTTLTGTFLVAREVTRSMLAREARGSIINIASVNAVIPTTGCAAYCSAKGGIEMFTKTAALELAPHHINVNAIGPGTTRTPLTELTYETPGFKEGVLEHSPMGRLGEVEDIAKVAVFLASEYASWVTGQLILADGGQGLIGLPPYYETLMGE